MELSIPPLLTYVVAWGGTILAIWFLFEKAEEVLTDDMRGATSRWLMNLKSAGESSNWQVIFVSVFDRLFGSNHFSWRCISRSCIASFVTVVLLTLIWGVVEPSGFRFFFRQFWHGAFLFIIILTISINFIADYLSLLETRCLIQWMRGYDSFLAILAFLVMDIVATTAIFIIGLSLHQLLLLGAEPMSILVNISDIQRYLEKLTTMTSSTVKLEGHLAFSPPLGIWFYSTFFTSIWIWVFALAGLFFKIARFFGGGVMHLGRVIDIEKKPLRSMGFVSIVLVSLLFLVFPFLR